MDPLLTCNEVLDRLRVHRQTLWAMRRRGDFPAPIRVASKIMWRSSTVESWLDSQDESKTKNKTRRRAKVR